MNWIKINFWEIERTPLLSYLGSLLSFLHILTYFSWLSHEHLFRSGGALLCWPFLPQCQSFTFLSPGMATTLFTFFLIFSCIAFFLFSWRRFLGLAWFALCFATMVKFLFYFLDASLSLDAHALILFLCVCYLFIPNKIRVFRAIVIFSYLILAYKLWSVEWLSGATLIHHWPIPVKGLEWVAGITMILYMTMPFLLISPISQRLALAVTSLAATHAAYYYFQRDLGSASLFFISLFFIFDHIEYKRLERESLYQSYEHPEPSRFWWIATASIFVFIQSHFMPHNYPLEVFRLEGPPSAAQCSSFTFVQNNSGFREIAEPRPSSVRQGLECHPWLNFNLIKEMCRTQKSDPQFKTISHYFFKRELGEQQFTEVFAEKDFCRDDLTYATASRGGR